MADSRQNIWRVLFVIGTLVSAGVVTTGCAIDAATTVVEERKFSDVINDTEIKANINKRLLNPTNSDLFFYLNTDVYEGRVMLTGSVKSERDRQRAVALMKGLRGIRATFNEIQVTDKGGLENTANDVWINAKIKAKYFAEIDVKSINLRWRVVNGTVYLLGFARNPRERQLMIILAKDTNHVQGVVDHISMK